MNRAAQENEFSEVDTKSATAVRQEVVRIFNDLFPQGDPACINTAFHWVESAFTGQYGDFQAIDAQYHDFEHTLQGTLCLVRLLQGYHRAAARPLLTERMFHLGVLAILLHDTGYLKKTGDRQGTGAKYTLVHVNRSADFAAHLLGENGFTAAEIRSVQNMIRCTGVNTDLQAIPFQSELEKVVGFALGTADLVGQMAANDYPDKLGILFQEFDESNRYNGRLTGPGVYKSASELRRSTPVFWESYVLPKINTDFLGLYRYLQTPTGENRYLERIKANISRVKTMEQGVAA